MSKQILLLFWRKPGDISIFILLFEWTAAGVTHDAQKAMISFIVDLQTYSGELKTHSLQLLINPIYLEPVDDHALSIANIVHTN